MIDICLILCQLALFPLLPVVLLTAMEYSRQEAGNRQIDMERRVEAGRRVQKEIKKDENSVRVEMEIDGCPGQKKIMHNVYFVHLFSTMPLYPK